MGNLYDRLVYGYVVDFIEFSFMNYAVFNFADALVNIGAVLLFVYLIFIDKSMFKNKEKEITEEKEVTEETEISEDGDIDDEE